MTPTGPVPPPSPSSRSRRFRTWLLPLPLLLVGLVGWWGWSRWESSGTGSEDEASASRRVASGGRDGAPAEAPGKGVGLPNGGAVSPGGLTSGVEPTRSPEERERERQRDLWTKRLERAKRTLDAYVAATRYPPESRPGREHVDQMELGAPERTRSLDRKGASGVQLRLKQDRVFLVGDEVVQFNVSCEDEQHAPRPCRVLSALAHEAEHVVGAGGVAPVPLAFVDDGTDGDTLAGDGILSGRFQPAKQGFPLFSGTLRVDVTVRSGETEGTAFFDVLYTPSPPARLTGRVREVVEAGSLQLYLGIQVQKAGRYVVAGRVDDEGGVPFAYVSFNEELKEGAQEVKLTLFGKLILDEGPGFPLKLRDVEGFLLKESGDPDRELLATLRGNVHTTNDYALTAFSGAEWQSEERKRYIDALTDDVKDAEKQLADATAGKPPP